MSGLFSRKKIPKVPMPEPRYMGTDTLQFPRSQASDRVIEPDRFGGMDEPSPFFKEEERLPNLPPPRSRAMSTPAKPIAPAPEPQEQAEPLYIKVDVYQRILGEINGIKSKFGDLGSLNKHLEKSECNEEDHFEKLRKSVKLIHDRLLQVDKIIFEGE